MRHDYLLKYSLEYYKDGLLSHVTRVENSYLDQAIKIAENEIKQYSKCYIYGFNEAGEKELCLQMTGPTKK